MGSSGGTIITLALGWLTMNFCLAIWNYYYVDAKVRPYAHRSLIDRHGWKAFGVFMYIFDFISIYPNGMVGFLAAGVIFKLVTDNSRPSGKPGCGSCLTSTFSILFKGLVLLLSAVLALSICLGWFIG
jgi:hypothetical protein